MQADGDLLPVSQGQPPRPGQPAIMADRPPRGLPHAGQVVTVELGDTTLRVTDPSGELLATVPRTSTGEISRFKAHGASTPSDPQQK
jgi:hypothetical protein